MAWILIVAMLGGNATLTISQQRYETREACETAKLNLAPWLNDNARKAYVTCTPAQ